MNRRSFVKTLSAMGVSATSLKYLSQKTLAEVTDNPKKEVPVLQFLRHTNHEEYIESVRSGNPIQPEREPVYEAVPRDKWAHIEGVHKAADAVRNKIENKFGHSPNTGISVGVETQTTGQHQEKIISVHYAFNKEEDSPISCEEIDEQLPDSVNGRIGEGEHSYIVEDIPVKSKVVRGSEHDSFDDKYRPVPAGCKIENSESGSATLGTPAYHLDYGNNVWVTAGHVVDSNDPEYVYQPGFDDYIGNNDQEYRVDFWCFDAGIIRPGSSGVGAKYDIASDSYWSDYEGWDIVGVTSWDRIKLNEGNTDYTVYKQGKETGRDSGYITRVDEEAFELSTASDDGDSGGPYFEVRDGESYINGVHGWPGGMDLCDTYNCCEDGGSHDGGARGTGMEFIEDEFNIVI